MTKKASIFLKLIRWLFSISGIFIGPKLVKISLIKNYFIDGLNLRIYNPDPSQKLPLIYYIHGGGFVCGNIKAYEHVCRYIAHHSQAIVAFSNYRLAPEYPYPAAAEDVEKIYKWILDNKKELHYKKIIIAGDSAGGNIASLLTQNLKEEELPKAQILIYPILDLTFKHNKDANYKKILYSFREYFIKNYLNGKTSQAYEVRNLPDTYIFTSGIDILAKEGEEFALKLDKENVKVEHKHYPKLPHGFINFAGISKNCKQALDNIIEVIKRIK